MSILGEMSEDLYEFLPHPRNCGVRDLLESPLLDSVLKNGLRHVYKMFYHTQHGNSEKLFDSTLQNSVWLEILGTTKSLVAHVNKAVTQTF